MLIMRGRPYDLFTLPNLKFSHWKHFFNFPPIFLYPQPFPGWNLNAAANGSANIVSSAGEEISCHRDVVVGHGSAYGLKSQLLTQAAVLRRFRDEVLRRLQLTPKPVQENAAGDLIFVALAGTGLVATTASQYPMNRAVCQSTKVALANLQRDLGLFLSFAVECDTLFDKSFEQEVEIAQRTSVLVTRDGTLSMTAFFLRDNSEVIVYNNESVTAIRDSWKENNINMFCSHCHFTWTVVREDKQTKELTLLNLESLLLRALHNRVDFSDDN